MITSGIRAASPLGLAEQQPRCCPRACRRRPGLDVALPSPTAPAALSCFHPLTGSRGSFQTSQHLFEGSAADRQLALFLFPCSARYARPQNVGITRTGTRRRRLQSFLIVPRQSGNLGEIPPYTGSLTLICFQVLLIVLMGRPLLAAPIQPRLRALVTSSQPPFEFPCFRGGTG